ncbi:SDR family NAD(P)-dependent oxidoreductase [Pseudooceanicola sp. GBMRC 2024]|uniref:SDR family NAD(P)-dependent oxidoreductase n=1 Tax=Pseudooceanicola albus TaxID=2692189 RepID=A0A6L7G364_9RHOB|nr:SDR family NAD(P)-dependent oxidoreductase [Pseudooceanicola albus]MXN17948.1 SDR family NAD(P)-dependent oxidoreductase [Pseudooceanicola albus]
MSTPKQALVTGASRGIGAAVARRLVAEGMVVHGAARGAEALEALARDLGPAFRPCPVDVTDPQAVLDRLNGAEIDVLVNNAGSIASVRPLHEQTPEETRATVALNLTAPLLLIQALLPGMIARGRGHVINLTSTAARATFAGTTTYAAAKAGLEQACRVLRYDLAGTGVRITDLAPGRVETAFYLESFGGDQAQLTEGMYRHERPLHPEDIAAAIWSLLSLPSHATVAEMVLSPTDQAPGGHVYRRPPGS